jgi:hypothetical protein
LPADTGTGKSISLRQLWNKREGDLCYPHFFQVKDMRQEGVAGSFKFDIPDIKFVTGFFDDFTDSRVVNV